MKRRNFIKSLALGITGLTASARINEAAREKPNIILITVDDLGWTDLACFGSKYYESPNIDKLASQGMKFTNAYAACAVCSPTRAAILTGQYPARIGITDWIHFRDKQIKDLKEKEIHPTEYVGKYNKLLCPPNHFWLDRKEITIAELLKNANYTSCHVGKWHLGPEKWYPEAQGFDYNYGGCDLGQPPSYFDPYFRSKKRPNIPTLKPRKEGEYLTDRENGEAVQFIRKHKNRPFFLNMWHYAVHTPIQAKKEIAEKYKKKIPTKQKHPDYAAMIESVDQAVGKLMKVLDELNLTDNTIIIFTSDNGGLKNPKGYPTDNSPLREGKGYPYEGGIRIPQIIKWPSQTKPGSVCHTPVTSVDFLPTICKMINIEPPKERLIDGESLVPLLTQTGNLKRKAIFWHFPHYRGKKIGPYSIIRKGKYKLIKHYEGKKLELYDLQKDISETDNLADTMWKKSEELHKDLTKWLTNTKAKLPVINPNPKRKKK